MLLGALQFQIKQNSGFPRLGRVAVRDQPAAMLSSTCAGRYKGLLADGAGALRGCGLIVVAQLTDHLSLLLLLLLLLWLFLAS